MTDREKGMLNVLEEYRKELGEKLLNISPKDKDFHQLRQLRAEMSNVIARVKKYCDENCKD